MTATRAISLDTIRDAARYVYAAAVRTPLIRLDLPGDRSRTTPAGEPLEVYLKLETLQPIGSFKIRGAYNAVRQIPPRERAEGVWTVSSGNAAQGVALAARLLDAPCSVMVIDTAAETKKDALRRLGAEIVGSSWDEAWQTLERHASDRMRGQLVHPFDDDRFISGTGTLGLEIVEDLPDVDAVVAAVGGGRAARGGRGRLQGPPPGRPRLRRRAGDGRPARLLPGPRRARRLPRVGGLVRRGRRRQVGAPDHVAPALRPGGRFDPGAPGRGRRGDAPRRRADARHRRRGGGVRRRGRPLRRGRTGEGRRRRLRGEHRPGPVRLARGRDRLRGPPERARRSIAVTEAGRIGPPKNRPVRPHERLVEALGDRAPTRSPSCARGP